MIRDNYRRILHAFLHIPTNLENGFIPALRMDIGFELSLPLENPPRMEGEIRRWQLPAPGSKLKSMYLYT
jgi:hypothetical protein